MPEQRTALITGALGVVGRALVEHLERDPSWSVIAVSRRQPDFSSRARWLALDLGERAACRAVLAGMAHVTHVFHAAYAPDPDLGREAIVNGEMLINLVEALEAARGSRLAHVQLMQGSKWYGNHLGPYRTPAREDDPRHGRPCFYYDQQDWLETRQRGTSWTWSALRPHGVLGLSIGSAMNQLTAIALYGAILRELGEPLAWPGAPGAFTAIYQFTEARWLARGMEWAATTPAAANQAFNFTNGDLVRWCHVWPEIARFFGLETAPPRQRSLAAWMADKERVWAGLVARHGLKRYRMDQLTSWPFVDFVLGCEYDQISDMTRARNAGWQGANDSMSMYVRLLEGLRTERIIP